MAETSMNTGGATHFGIDEGAGSIHKGARPDDCSYPDCTPPRWETYDAWSRRVDEQRNQPTRAT
jgi:hypothetical protein